MLRIWALGTVACHVGEATRGTTVDASNLAAGVDSGPGLDSGSLPPRTDGGPYFDALSAPDHVDAARSRPDAPTASPPDAEVAPTPDAPAVLPPDAYVAPAPDAPTVLPPDAYVASAPDALTVLPPDAYVAPAPDAQVMPPPDASVPAIVDGFVAPAIDAQAGGIGSYSDDFAGPGLNDSWGRVNAPLMDYWVSDGHLFLRPNQYCVWFHGEEGPMLEKTITGNFKVTSLVRARSFSDPSNYVGPSYQFGGLMARNPVASAPNYVFVVVGDRGGYLSIESKTTRDGSSTVTGPPYASGDAELRICRVGSTFYMYSRAEGELAWTQANVFDRPDLPESVQVGPIAYTYTGNPDLLASFDRVEFALVTTVDDCIAD